MNYINFSPLQSTNCHPQITSSSPCFFWSSSAKCVPHSRAFGRFRVDFATSRATKWPPSRSRTALGKPTASARALNQSPAKQNGGFSHGCFLKWWYTPKSFIFIGFSIIFTIHFGVPLFLETPTWRGRWKKKNVMIDLLGGIFWGKGFFHWRVYRVFGWIYRGCIEIL